MAKYTLKQKIDALEKIKSGANYDDISNETQIPIGSLKKWYRQRDTIRRDYHQHLRDEANHKMVTVQHDMANKAVELIAAIDAERITKAPLNQVASTLGILIDRILKLQDVEEDETHTAEQVIRIEYYDATTGEISKTPPWAENHSESSGTIQSRGVRATLRQDDDGTNYRNGKSDSWDADVVARSNLSDGESGLARFEDDDDERDWYHD